MTANAQPSPIRGAIKTSISASTDVLVAGQDFSLFVTIQNPFEVELLLHRISTYLPTELLDVDKILRDLQAQEIEEHLASLEEAGQSLGIEFSHFIPRRISPVKKFFAECPAFPSSVLGLILSLSSM